MVPGAGAGAGAGGPGELVAGRYRLEQVLGRGGMGVVWRAVDTLIERTVALKELRPPQGDETSSFVDRALREARNAGRLNHPGIVAVHDVIAPVAGDDPVVYIVMEYVEAPSLAEVIDRQGPLAPGRVAAMGVRVLDALMAAHAMGIVHRDVKPGNVLVGEGDRVKLTDFGIALAAEDARLTRTGVTGTHAYLAPECFDHDQVGPAADLWAFGATLFHAVAGRPPFERPTTTATLRAILFEEPPPPPCGPPLAEVITGLLTRSVDQRLTGGSAHDLLERAVASLPTVEAPPPPPPVPTPGGGASAWAAPSTTHHRPPAPHAPGPLSPSGPPSPPLAAPSLAPPPPPGSPPPHAGPPSSPSFAPPFPPGPSGPAVGVPLRKSSTSLILGVLGAAAAVVVLVVVLVLGSGGGSDDDPGSQAGGAGAETDDGGGAGESPEAELPPSGDGLDPGLESDPAVTGGQALAREFLDLVESGDSATAIDMLCDVGDPTDAIADIHAVAGAADLELDMSTAEVVSQGIVLSVDLTGTVDGQDVSYAHIGTAARDSCIVTFSASSG